MSWKNNKTRISMEESDIGGNFEWVKEPRCFCNGIMDAIADGYAFVFNFQVGGYNPVYLMLKGTNDDDVVRKLGTAINNCPWCGGKLQAIKRAKRRP